MESLRRMKMIEPNHNVWIVRKEAPKRNKERLSRRMGGESSSHAPPPRSPLPPPLPPHEPPTEHHHSPIPPFDSSHDYMGLSARMDRLEENARHPHSRFEEHARFQYDYYSWQEKMSQAFFSCYGYSNYYPPPPHPFFPTHAAPSPYKTEPSRTTTLNNSTGEDEGEDINIEGDDSDDGGDDGDEAMDVDDIETNDDDDSGEDSTFVVEEVVPLNDDQRSKLRHDPKSRR